MREDVEVLIESIQDETEMLDDLISVVRDQREVMKDQTDADTHLLLDDLMTEMREVSFDVEAQESLRYELAQKLAAQFGCAPQASSLVAAMEDDEKELFNVAVDKLTQSVFALKAEMTILSGLIEHNEKYASMLISEWQRVMGEDNISSSTSGTADFRG